MLGLLKILSFSLSDVQHMKQECLNLTNTGHRGFFMLNKALTNNMTFKVDKSRPNVSRH